MKSQKEGDSGPLRDVTPWKKKKYMGSKIVSGEVYDIREYISK
jgi:hypothetical protein